MHALLTALDIGIVAFFVYAILILLKRTQSIFIFRGIITLLVVYLVALFLRLSLTVELFQIAFPFFSIIIVVIFQREFRRFFEGFSIGFIRNFFTKRTTPEHEKITKAVLGAIDYFTLHKIGALIVFPGIQPIERHLEGGYALDGRVSTPLLISIFDTGSPGHDGALILENGRISRFGVHLPLAEQLRKVKEYGTRHRAGLGLSERTDALVLIVSEERGTISIAENGTFRQVTIEELAEIMGRFNKTKEKQENATMSWYAIFTTDLTDRLTALAIALILWLLVIPR